MRFIDSKCRNCGSRISLAEKDLYAGYCMSCLKWGYISDKTE
jgi:hypothetical protein